MNKLNGMTGFGWVQLKANWGQLHWEIRTLNHRFLDILLRLPEGMGAEAELLFRNTVQRYLTRGRVEASLQIVLTNANHSIVSVNESLAAALLKTGRHLAQQFDLPEKIAVRDVLNWPGLVTITSQYSEAMIAQINQSLSDGLAHVCQRRAQEGAMIEQALKQRLASIEIQLQGIKTTYKESSAQQIEVLRQKASQLADTIDPKRLDQEIVLLLQKSDIDEEIARLANHLSDFAQYVHQGGVIGRQLDFVLQEMNREANTIAAKANHAAIAKAVIAIKVLLEQMREQVQNLE